MIEYLAPAVYLTEIPFSATPIEGVSTSTAEVAGASGPEQPAWTDANQGDPGVTLLEFFSWADDWAVYRAAHSVEHPGTHAAVGAGVVGGLSLDADGQGAHLSVTPGTALGPDGRPVDARIARARRVIDPD